MTPRFKLSHKNAEAAVDTVFESIAHSLETGRRVELRGFEVIGQLPKAFHHWTQGFVDALVMYQWITDQESPP